MRTPPHPRDDLRFSNTTGILQKKKKTMWFIGVEVEQETSAPPPKKKKSWIRLCVHTHVNKKTFERNSSLEYYHKTCVGKTKHTT